MTQDIADLRTAIAFGTTNYPVRPPFNPPERFPEYPWRAGDYDPSNAVYSMVRETLRLLGLDNANYGGPAWNPLGGLIAPGQRVLIKPNFVLHFNAGGGPLDAVVTHPSIIRALADYVAIALVNRGQILVGDAPQMNCDFDVLLDANGSRETFAFLGKSCGDLGISFQALDFRREQTCYRHGIVWSRKALARPAKTGVRVTLGAESWMEPIDCTRLYGADYNRRQTVDAHTRGGHVYLIVPEVLSSDVVISVPKLKVHRKVGATLNLKNMVGINADKNNIAHYRVGGPSAGGDEFSAPRWDDRLDRRLSDLILARSDLGKYPFLGWRAFRKLYRRLTGGHPAPAFTFGNWHGNDTAWRMVLDLNRIILRAGQDGRFLEQAPRRYFALIDGVVGGEGEGPLAPDPYPSGVVLAGFNPVAVDWIAASLIGLDPARIPLYANAVEQMREWVPGFGPEYFRVLTEKEGIIEALISREPIFRFRPAAGWTGRVELYPALSVAPGNPEKQLAVDCGQ